jgi:hypothetical protein
MIDVFASDSVFDWTEEEIEAMFEPGPICPHDQEILDNLEPINWDLVKEGVPVAKNALDVMDERIRDLPEGPERDWEINQGVERAMKELFNW